MMTWDDWKKYIYHKTSNISHTLVGNKIIDHSDVVGASPVGAAPTTSSFSTWHLASRDSVKKAARQFENLLSVDLVQLILETWRYVYFTKWEWGWGIPDYFVVSLVKFTYCGLMQSQNCLILWNGNSDNDKKSTSMSNEGGLKTQPKWVQLSSKLLSSACRSWHYGDMIQISKGKYF